ncbi:MAG: hypothetical protein K2I72_01445, partial [Bacilli bacterium]|nr:hypothetical protein [Bacilli bacterium]
IANIYLLGKLAVNKTVGWLLIVGFMLTAKYTMTINCVETSYLLLPENVNSIVIKMLSCLVFVLLIYGIKRYFEIKRQKEISIDSKEENK